ncbi:hypothetical protein A1Q1_03639 [Trichosporon asahii var. asahii CBS 2479]|uniref:Uncharacterized protein n=1 Tax=Trichosporon asahii var. asahii (strain ATCC 90039 / CBS 2479 / JCM 2466 / KCTC 7840 / NBRC 103889/ NCYC 2677 / UAMH 7654) TaxID=1186058 RepID=J6EXI9_TRIAS|nr:hypothetical protein A1Q1_03639 [Trichosporon asahii var. asahii CBS 2479]EJT47527.1 hypothetical protein A1Q1_03639 [Trichosporon asahii var. asahii CBS 2479]
MIGPAALVLLGWAATEAIAAKVIVDNVSPMITYTPPLYGDRAESDDRWDPNRGLNAWNTTFPQVTEYRPWDLRKPTDQHYTFVKVQGIDNYPTAEISFVGTGIVLIGPDPNPGEKLGTGFAKLKLDGKEQDCRSTGDATLLQCSIRDLEFGRHHLTVEVQQGGFAIGRFEIDTGKEDNPTAVVDLSDDNKRVTNGGEYDVAVDGQWDGENQSTNYDKSLVVKWNRAVSQYNGTSISAKIPKGIGRVEVWGAVDVDHYDFAVEIDPPAYGLTRFNGNAFNLYTVQNISMYETMLDPGKPHTIKVTNMHDAYLDVSQFKLYEAHGGSGGSGLSAGAIAGIVIGSVAALALACLLVWCCLRRRKKQATNNNPVDMESDPGDMVNVHDVEPYHDSPHSPPMSMSTGAGYRSSGSIPMAYAPSATSAGIAGLGAYQHGQQQQYHTQQQCYAIPTPPSASHQSSGSTSEPLLGMTPGSPFSPLAVQNPDDEGYLAASTSTVGIAALDAKVQPRPVTYHHLQHTDSGLTSHSNEVVVTEAPPVYNPEWAGSSSANSGGAPTVQSAPSALSAPSDADRSRNSRMEKGPSAPMSPV